MVDNYKGYRKTINRETDQETYERYLDQEREMAIEDRIRERIESRKSNK